MPGVTTFLDLLGGDFSNINGSNNQPQLKDGASVITYVTWDQSNDSSLVHLNVKKKLSKNQLDQIQEACEGNPLKNIGIRLIGNNLQDQFGLKIVSIENKSNSNLNHHIVGDNHFHTLLKTDNQETILKNISSNEEELTTSQFEKDLTYNTHLNKFQCISDSVTGLAISAAGKDLTSKLERQAISDSDNEVFFITKEMKKIMQDQVEERSKASVGNFKTHIELPKPEELEFELVPLVHATFEKMSNKSIRISNQKIIAIKIYKKINNIFTIKFKFFY